MSDRYRELHDLSVAFLDAFNRYDLDAVMSYFTDDAVYEELTGRALYADCRIGEIRTGRDNQLLEVKLPGSETFLQPGQAVGDVDADALKRLMIRRTIHEHLVKETRLAPLGIKVLSLFFIDACTFS